ncbi:MAG: pyridoxal phosphate-dependent aminotransferase [Clostridium sp.]|nr:pyridoxal phosphate-dependent aminotransferase [Clostridium sp.]
MNYNFDEIIPRKGTNSYKWDSATDDSILPLWVADMDFRTAPEIIETLRQRVEHGIFGYTKVPERYYEAIISWFARRHDWHTITRDMIIYTSGVVPALSAVIKALTTTGDKVILQTPVYNCFFSSIRNNGCEVADCPLINENGTYRMDYDALERTAADPKARLLLLCNPHNPAGRVWTREELTRLGDICMRHGVTVIADEIHCELTFPGHPYTPFASISEEFLSHSVTCNSPSKAFNIAGLQIANIVAADEDMRARIDRAININEVCDVNPFGVEALIAAYGKGEDWLQALLVYLEDNYRLLCDFFAKHLPDYPVFPLEGTYLVWVDCRKTGMSSEEMEQRLMNEAGLWLNAGSMYGTEGFMRINIACPRSVLAEGLKRLANFINKL